MICEISLKINVFLAFEVWFQDVLSAFSRQPYACEMQFLGVQSVAHLFGRRRSGLPDQPIRNGALKFNQEVWNIFSTASQKIKM